MKDETNLYLQSRIKELFSEQERALHKIVSRNKRIKELEGIVARHSERIVSRNKRIKELEDMLEFSHADQRTSYDRGFSDGNSAGIKLVMGVMRSVI
jgi:predicted  nucleic acid-binding Zn-ribbon protein